MFELPGRSRLVAGLVALTAMIPSGGASQEGQPLPVPVHASRDRASVERAIDRRALQELAPPRESVADRANTTDARAQEPPAERPSRVTGAETIDDLLSATSGSTGTDSQRNDREPSSLTGSFLRLVGWTLAVAGLAIGFLFFLRKFTPVGQSFHARGALKVLGRTSLSPRHTVFLVRVGNQRVVAVGVSGDRMVTLSEISDPAGVLACDDSFRATLAEHGAGDLEDSQDGLVVEAPGRRGAESSFRGEVERLRGVVRSWRGVFARDAAAGARVPAGAAGGSDSGETRS